MILVVMLCIVYYGKQTVNNKVTLCVGQTFPVPQTGSVNMCTVCVFLSVLVGMQAFAHVGELLR